MWGQGEETHRWISARFSSFSSTCSFLIACSFLVFSIRSSHFLVLRPSGRCVRLDDELGLNDEAAWTHARERTYTVADFCVFHALPESRPDDDCASGRAAASSEDDAAGVRDGDAGWDMFLEF